MGDFKKKFAVIVGVSEYDGNERIAPLAFAKNDAVRLYQTLSQYCGFAREHLYLFSNGIPQSGEISAQSPSRANLLKCINYVSDNAGADDLIVLFFAGHGVEISSAPYLITEDTKMDVLRETAIDVTLLNEMLGKSRAGCLLRIFDACRSPFAVGRGQEGQMTDILERALCHTAKGWATIRSCSSGQVSYEDGDFQAGVFSHFLCEGLTGKAANTQGEVTLDALVDYVRISVGNWCDSQTLKQTPHVQSDLSGVLVLSRRKLDVVPVVLPAGSPFAELNSGLALHLSKSPSDARHLEFTDAESFSILTKHAFGALKEFLGDLSRQAMTAVSASDPGPLQNIDGVWARFFEEMHGQGVYNEFRQDTSAIRLAFRSSEVLVCGSNLYMSTARFSFFYWLWYWHRCEVPELQGTFRPEPQQHSGFFTFKAGAARDPLKVEGAVREMLTRSSTAMLQWTKQLGEFVNARLDPLRRMKSIIE